MGTGIASTPCSRAADSCSPATIHPTLVQIDGFDLGTRSVYEVMRTEYRVQGVVGPAEVQGPE